ncbi:MAG: hypothetical protein LC803_16590 [Acidobacteria bacterium]|nr:hypothetical protein [Acidobacteriota bacterium]
MRKLFTSMLFIILVAAAADAQGGSAASPTLKVGDGTKSFNGVNELRVPAGCVTFSGRTAIINCTGGGSSGTTSSQNANLFFASPNGSYGLPSWRAVVEADLPSLGAAKITSGIFATGRLGSGTPSSSTYLRGDGAWAALPADSVTSVFGRTGAVVAVSGDYTWAQINKATSSLADITTRSAGDLSSGTLPDARFPSTLPALSGVNLTSLNASNLASGTVSTARLGSGTASSSTYLRGDQTWAALPASVGGSGTAGTLAKFATATTLADSIISESGGKVGIGVAPDAGLSLALASNLGVGTTGQIQVVGNYAGSGEIPAGGYVGSAGSSSISLIPSSTAATAGAKATIVYHNGASWYSAVDVANVAGGGTTRGTLSLMKSGGAVEIGGTTKQGANGTAVALERLGTCTLVAGACTVSDTNVTASSRIFLTAQDNNSTGALRISARTAATSFTITSSNAADNGLVAWHLVN